MAESNSEFIFYQTEDQQTRIQVRLKGETVWLSLNEMAELFQRDKSVISKHIKNVFAEGELPPLRKRDSAPKSNFLSVHLLLKRRNEFSGKVSATTSQRLGYFDQPLVCSLTGNWG